MDRRQLGQARPMLDNHRLGSWRCGILRRQRERICGRGTSLSGVARRFVPTTIRHCCGSGNLLDFRRSKHCFPIGFGSEATDCVGIERMI
jgi:hypothetical protein